MAPISTPNCSISLRRSLAHEGRADWRATCHLCNLQLETPVHQPPPRPPNGALRVVSRTVQNFVAFATKFCTGRRLKPDLLRFRVSLESNGTGGSGYDTVAL
jgi:hypothetical protein